MLVNIDLERNPKGVAAIQELRAGLKIPVLCLTANAESSAPHEGHSNDTLGCDPKPAEDWQLLALIENAIHRHSVESGRTGDEEQARAYEAACRVGVFDWQFETRKFLMTPELEEIFGVRTGSFEGTFDAWTDFIYPNDRYEVLVFLQQWLESDRPEQRLVYRVRRPDGDIRWVEMYARVRRSQLGRVGPRSWDGGGCYGNKAPGRCLLRPPVRHPAELR